MRPRMGTFESSTRVAKTTYTLPAASSPSKFLRHWSAPCSRRHPEAEAPLLKSRARIADKFGMFDWNNEYAVNIPSIDAQHQNLFAIGRELYAAMRDRKSTRLNSSHL